MPYLKSILLCSIIPFSIFCSNQINDDENRAQYLFENIMCPVCDGQTISESQSQLVSKLPKPNIVNLILSPCHLSNIWIPDSLIV